MGEVVQLDEFRRRRVARDQRRLELLIETADAITAAVFGDDKSQPSRPLTGVRALLRRFSSSGAGP
jgi:hypothetical protein